MENKKTDKDRPLKFIGLPAAIVALFSAIFIIRQNMNLTIVLLAMGIIGLGFYFSWKSYRESGLDMNKHDRALAYMVAVVIIIPFLLIMEPSREFIFEGFRGTAVPTITPTVTVTTVLTAEPKGILTVTEAVRPETEETWERKKTSIVQDVPLEVTKTFTPTPTKADVLPIVAEPGDRINLENAGAVHAVANFNDTWVENLAWSPDGRYLAVSTTYGVMLFQLEPFQSIRTVGRNISQPCIAFFSDGRLATASDGVIIWNVETGGQMAQFDQFQDVDNLDISPDDQWMAIQIDQAVLVVESSTGHILKTIQVGTVTAPPVFSPDGTKIVAPGMGIKIFDINSGDLVETLDGHTSGVRRVVFSQDGSLLASSSLDQTAKIWNFSSGLIITSLDGHTDEVGGVSLSPDGTVAATISMDQTVRLWEANSGKSITTLAGHTSQGRRLAFSPDGRWIASSDYSGKLILWGLEP